MKTKTNVKAGAGGDKPVKYMTYTMKDVLITSVNPSS
jgi:type VI protein secretion system component Hcp